MKVLLDLSVLSQPQLSRGVGRYVKNLAYSLFAEASANPGLELLATAGRPVLGVGEISADVPRVVEAMARAPLAHHPLSWVRSGHRALVRAVARTRPDLLHSLDPWAATAGRFSCPYVLTCHHVDSALEVDQWHGTDARVPRRQRALFTSADHVIASSRATAQELIARLDIPRQAITVVHHGLKLATWGGITLGDSILERYRIVRPYLLCVGGADERKNVDRVFYALAKARNMLAGARPGLVWVGALTPAETLKVRRAAAEVGLLDVLQLPGYLPDRDLAALYQAAITLLFVSRREGFGFPLVEAMAAGCPVITSNRSSLIEVGEGAVLSVDPLDVDAIADAIVLVCDDAKERRRLAERGRKRAEDFSLNQMVQGTLAAYRKTITLRLGEGKLSR